jgi:hypothetical protein
MQAAALLALLAKVGFANTSNSDGNSELRSGAVISIDGSSSAVAANPRPVSKLPKLPNILMTNYTDLTSVVKSAADISLQTNTDFVITLCNTACLKEKFSNSVFDSCPTVQISPQGEVLHSLNPAVFFRVTTCAGLVANPWNDAWKVIVSYYGSTGQVRLTRPL